MPLQWSNRNTLQVVVVENRALPGKISLCDIIGESCTSSTHFGTISGCDIVLGGHQHALGVVLRRGDDFGLAFRQQSHIGYKPVLWVIYGQFSPNELDIEADMRVFEGDGAKMAGDFSGIRWSKKSAAILST